MCTKPVEMELMAKYNKHIKNKGRKTDREISAAVDGTSLTAAVLFNLGNIFALLKTSVGSFLRTIRSTAYN